MKKIIIKASVSAVLAILMAKESNLGVMMGIICAVLFYNIISWFEIIYKELDSFEGVARCILSFLGSVFIIVVPMSILQALLPDNWFRTTLITIVTLIMLAIPFVRDWKGYKSVM